MRGSLTTFFRVVSVDGICVTSTKVKKVAETMCFDIKDNVVWLKDI